MKRGEAAPAVSIATAGALEEVKALLARCGLPTADIHDGILFVVARSGSELCGSAGAELFGRMALLRSVAVHPQWRGKGIGRSLCDDLIARLRAAGVQRAFLLTTDAQRFFATLRFSVLQRGSLPMEILGTAQFRELCPQTAVAMMRDL